MRAVTVVPGTAGSLRVDEVPDPDERLGSVLVEALAVGICGTDTEIAEGGYGWSPPERDRLILGHESADRGWLEQLITRRVNLEHVPSGLQRAPADIKVIVEMASPWPAW